MAKILLLDVETAPSLGWVWGKYDQNVIEFQQSWFMLSFAYKWFGQDDIPVHALPDYPNYGRNKKDDKALMQDLWRLLDEADIVVAHNGDAFDLKKANARFVFHGLPPPSPYKTVDTLKLARKHFKFESNKLNDVCQHLGIGKKVAHTGFKIWRGCMEGDMEAWAVMKEYNPHDIVLLEGLYVLIRSWGAHPDLGIIDGVVGVCPSCGSGHIQKRGLMHLKTRSYQRLNCQDCGSWFKGDYVKK